MRLNSARIQNFKLLRDIRIEFSKDRDRPLTLIRAENGSGKTSLLSALRWGMYGQEGQPGDLRKVRMVSTSSLTRVPVEVRVEIDFEQFDEITNDYVRYRLIRTVVETPLPGDKFEREREALQMFRAEGTGWKPIGDGAQGLVSKFVPPRLANVFFTDGDDVQQFVSNQVALRERQEAVHNAVRLLLGLEELDTAVKDLDALGRKYRSDIGNEVGGELKEIEEQLESRRKALEGLIMELEGARDRRRSIEDYITRTEKELRGMGDVSDLEELNQKIDGLERDIKDADNRIAEVFNRMRKGLFKGSQISWALMRPKISEAMEVLKDLDSRGVIPGTSVEVLKDRLALNECICGEKLSEGDRRWMAILELINAQVQHAPERRQKTEVWHLARSQAETQLALRDERDAVGVQLKATLGEVTRLRDTRKGKARELEDARVRREGIDQERVTDLTDRLRKLRGDLRATTEAIGGLQLRVDEATTNVNDWEKRFREAEEKVSVAGVARARNRAADDLRGLANRILTVLKDEWVARVSTKMNELFLEIVGADPDHAGDVFRRVYITDEFDIVVESGDGRSLDFDHEVNGASQRALTLSFIWALMEVTGREAPRVIDTPLGMVSGGVRRRMVKLITQPAPSGGPNRQVVLLMTRAEIRDVELLLEERMGVALTLSCSKDYPTDLKNDWGGGPTEVRKCECDHTQFCEVCARRDDGHFGLRERVGQ